MWIGRRAWMELTAKVDKALRGIEENTESTKVLNHEYGAIKHDVGWLTWQSRLILAVVIGTAFTLIWKSLGA